MSKLINGSRETDYGLVFPMTWTTSSKAWAMRVGLPQPAIDDIERELSVFRRKRDNHRAGIFEIVQPKIAEVA